MCVLNPLCFQQGILWKRSGSSLNKEWKKKYVALSNNGTLSYHSSSNVREQPTLIDTAVKPGKASAIRKIVFSGGTLSADLQIKPHL